MTGEQSKPAATPSKDVRCKQVVMKRDTYRYTGRGKSGFEMHYTKTQCTRRADETGFCWQHQINGKPGRAKW